MCDFLILGHMDQMNSLSITTLKENFTIFAPSKKIYEGHTAIHGVDGAAAKSGDFDAL